MSTSFILNPHRFGAAADPGLTLLQGATLWLDASDMASGAQWLRNKGTGGRGLDARVGSVGSAQIINGALKLPGLASNVATAPDVAAMRPTGDLEIVARVAPADWTPGTNSRIVNSGANGTSSMNYGFSVHTDGKLLLERYPSGGGGGIRFAYSTVATGFTDGTTRWIKVEFDADNGAGGSDFRFYTAADQTTEPSSWTQLGSTVTVAAWTGAGNSNTDGLAVGASAGATLNMFNGNIFRVVVRNGIGGTIVFDADFTAQTTLATSFTESSSNAATVTINSTTGVDGNDPTLLTHTGTNYLYLPGLASNNATVPDSATWDAAAEYEMIVRITAAYSGANTIAAKRTGTGGDGWQWYFSGGQIKFFNAASGTPDVGVTHALTDGTTYWLRVTANATARTFYFAADQASIPSSWTQIGAAQAALGGMNNNSGPLAIGGDSNSGYGTSSVYRFVLRTTIGGANQIDADFTANTNQSSFTESSSNAATVTINRHTSGRKAVMVVRPTLLFGSDDYLEVADNDLLDLTASGDMTVLAVCRRSVTAPNNGRIVSKRDGSGTNVGWDVLNESATLAFTALMDVGATNSTFPINVQQTMTANQLHLVGAIFDRTNALVKATIGSSISTGASMPAGDASNTKGLFIGRLEGATPAYNDMEICHVAVFRSALTSTELGQIASYLGV